ncbi:MAG: Fic family protein [Alphaproteobacteria bacterium]|nr:MAG: Fic family protein [Alphaproteobacteria bacterium]
MTENKRIGEYVTCAMGSPEPYRAYIPPPLPPQPPLDMERLYPMLEKANLALGRLEGISTLLPDISLFLYMYIRKEAVLSSQIEGTQSTLTDLLSHEANEAPGVPIHDVQETSCYVAAMTYGLERIQELPLSLRLLREIHDILLSHSRGKDKDPGEFRRSQNWIGGFRPGHARYVPPPPERLMEVLDAFEKFLHDRSVRLPILVKAALAHVQFESIHPFLDGNGRLGRLLITLMLCVEGVMKEPLLYLSLYLKTHRQAYYDHLQSVRETGDWESWIEFFLTGVRETADHAVETAQAVLKLFEKDRGAIRQAGSSKAAALAVHEHLQRHPVTNTTMIKKSSGLSAQTVLRGLAVLESLGMVQEITGKERYKKYAYTAYMDILNKGTEPLER